MSWNFIACIVVSVLLMFFFLLQLSKIRRRLCKQLYEVMELTKPYQMTKISSTFRRSKHADEMMFLWTNKMPIMLRAQKYGGMSLRELPKPHISFDGSSRTDRRISWQLIVLWVETHFLPIFDYSRVKRSSLPKWIVISSVPILAINLLNTWYNYIFRPKSLLFLTHYTFHLYVPRII